MSAIRDYSSFSRLSKFNDFELVYKGKKYYTYSKMLYAISPTIRETKSMSFEIPPVDGDISQFLEMLKGKPINIDAENAPLLHSIALSLKLDNLKEKSLDVIYEKCKPKAVVDLVKVLYSLNLDVLHFITYIASKIDSFLHENVFGTEFQPALAKSIIMSPSLKCRDTSRIVEFVLNLYEKSSEDMLEAVKAVIERFPSPITLTMLFECPFLNINLLKDSLVDVLLNTPASSDRTEAISIPYSKGNEFKGVVEYFRERHRLFSSLTVTATSEFSPEYSRWNLFEYDSPAFFSSLGGPFENVQVHLTHSALALTHYTLASADCGRNGIAPVTWTLKGSNDGATWVLLDAHTDDRSLCGCSEVVTFPVVSHWEHFRYFRLTQVESGGKRNKRMVLAGFELFGVLTEK